MLFRSSGSFARFNPRLQLLSLSLQTDNLLLQLQAPRARGFSSPASFISSLPIPRRIRNSISHGSLRCSKLRLRSRKLLASSRHLLIRSLPRPPMTRVHVIDLKDHEEVAVLRGQYRRWLSLPDGRKLVASDQEVMFFKPTE